MRQRKDIFRSWPNGNCVILPNRWVCIRGRYVEPSSRGSANGPGPAGKEVGWIRTGPASTGY